MFYYFQVQSKVKLIYTFAYTCIYTTQARKLMHLITELLGDTGDTLSGVFLIFLVTIISPGSPFRTRSSQLL